MYSKGTGLPINAVNKKSRTNTARVGALPVIASTGGVQRVMVGVARKPAKNKAAK